MFFALWAGPCWELAPCRFVLLGSGLGTFFPLLAVISLGDSTSFFPLGSGLYGACSRRFLCRGLVAAPACKYACLPRRCLGNEAAPAYLSHCASISTLRRVLPSSRPDVLKRRERPFHPARAFLCVTHSSCLWPGLICIHLLMLDFACFFLTMSVQSVSSRYEPFFCDFLVGPRAYIRYIVACEWLVVVV